MRIRHASVSLSVQDNIIRSQEAVILSSVVQCCSSVSKDGEIYWYSSCDFA